MLPCASVIARYGSSIEKGRKTIDGPKTVSPLQFSICSLHVVHSCRPRKQTSNSSLILESIAISEMPEITEKVYLEISIDDVPAGRIVLGLFGKVAPRTVKNFKRLCTCDAGKGKLSGLELCYKGSLIHRISKFPQCLMCMLCVYMCMYILS